MSDRTYATMTPLKEGDGVSLTHRFTEAQVQTFADLSLDANPIHLDAAFAEQTAFGKRIVHGMLVSSLFSGILGEQLPGPGTIYLGQTLSFKAPVYLDEEITVNVEVRSVREDKPIATLSTQVVKADGTLAVDGEAVVKVPRHRV